MFRIHWKSLLAAICLLSFCFQAGLAQQRAGSLRGQVSDELGALVVGATVTLIAADGTQKTADNQRRRNLQLQFAAARTIHDSCSLSRFHSIRKD